jgi:hypothetical protein
MRPTRTAGSLLAILCLQSLAVAEAQKTKAESKPATAKTAAAKDAKPTPLAQVGDVTITEAEVQKLVGDPISRMWSEFEQKVQQVRNRPAPVKPTCARPAWTIGGLRPGGEGGYARGVTVEELTG